MKDKNNTLLWIVDCQHDFMDADGKLYVEGAEDIKSNLKKVMEDFKDYPMVFTQDWHYYNSEELSKEPDFVNTFPDHCMAGTIGAELIEEVKPYGYDLIMNWDQDTSTTDVIHTITKDSPFKIMLRKDKFDFFAGNKNSEYLLFELSRKFENVYVIGVVSEICVKYAIDRLLYSGFGVNLIEKAIMHINLESYQENLSKWNNNNKFKLII